MAPSWATHPGPDLQVLQALFRTRTGDPSLPWRCSPALLIDGSGRPIQDLVPLQDAVQTVAGDVAALQALVDKALHKRHLRVRGRLDRTQEVIDAPSPKRRASDVWATSSALVAQTGRNP
jgi:hypothetical protein